MKCEICKKPIKTEAFLNCKIVCEDCFQKEKIAKARNQEKGLRVGLKPDRLLRPTTPSQVVWNEKVKSWMYKI